MPRRREPGAVLPFDASRARGRKNEYRDPQVSEGADAISEPIPVGGGEVQSIADVYAAAGLPVPESAYDAMSDPELTAAIRRILSETRRPLRSRMLDITELLTMVSAEATSPEHARRMERAREMRDALDDAMDTVNTEDDLTVSLELMPIKERMVRSSLDDLVAEFWESTGDDWEEQPLHFMALYEVLRERGYFHPDSAQEE